MKDPESRRRLKEMLDFQMKEKLDRDPPGRMRAQAIMRQAGRPPLIQSQPIGNQAMISNALPPLNNIRSATPSHFSMGFAPSP